MTERRTSKMKRLPELAPPTSMAANVMARIARLPDERSQIPRVVDTPRTVTRPSLGERLAWTWGLAGVVIVFGTYDYSKIVAGTLPDLTASRIGYAQLVTMPVEGPAMFFLAVGLLLYLTGMFSPLRRATSKERGATAR